MVGDFTGIFAEHRGHGLRGSVAAEGALAAEHFVKDRSKRKNVRARVGRLSTHLLGSHVARGAEHDAGRCAHRGNCRSVIVRRSLNKLGETEVQNFDPAVFGDENIFGLQVAMDDALFVRAGHTLRDLHAVLDGFALRQRAAFHNGAQALAFEQLGNEKGRAILLADVKNREDIGVIQRGDRAGFQLKTMQAIRIGCKCLWEYLQGNIAPEARVLCAVDFTHSTRADGRTNLVRPDLGPSRKQHECRGVYGPDVGKERGTRGARGAWRAWHPPL
jgi:hypothetical protein